MAATSAYLNRRPRSLAEVLAARGGPPDFHPDAWVERPYASPRDDPHSAKEGEGWVERGRVTVSCRGWTLVDFGTYRAWLPSAILRPAPERAA